MHQLAAPAFAEIEIKKSRFLGQLYPVGNRAEARDKLAGIRAQHPGAVHVCWVLLCEGDSGLDDDGEPSGTAAKPMYNVLVHKDVMNALAVVVRYWGGCKLGAGGLTRAYGQAISEAFKSASLIAVEATLDWEIRVAFGDESQLRRICERFEAAISEVRYAEAATLQIKLKEKFAGPFETEAKEVLKGKIDIRKVANPPE
ncbi:MAG: YigZ family protein [Burkholderiales bacterium]|nr:YigZ family protein [Burkholderiales bacterium]